MLPDGWDSACLEDLVEFTLGGQWGDPPSAHPVPDTLQVNVIRGTEFRRWRKEKGSTAAVRQISTSSFQKRRLLKGDIVVEISGGGPDQPVGRTLVIDKPALENAANPLICSNFCRQLRLYPPVDSHFVNFGLVHQYSKGRFNIFQTETTNIRNLNFSRFLGETEIPLPPTVEQKRISEQIAALLTQVTCAQNRLFRVPAILRRFRQAVLAAACSGRLTEDWRVQRASRTSATEFLRAILAMRPERVKEQGVGAVRKPTGPDESQLSDVPEEWAITNIDEVSCMVTSGSRGWAKYYAESGPLFIRAQDINTDRLQTDGIAHVEPPDNAEGRRTRVRFGDLLVTITGANVTKAALVDREIGESYVSQHVALVRPVDPSIGQFLYLWVVSPRHGRAKLLDDAYGAGKPGLNLDNIKETTLAFPSLEEQREIVRRVDALFKLADAIDMRVATATRRADKLTESILSKAFRGDLVLTEAELARREGREYEPASVLLERIRAERANHAQTSPSPKRRVRKSNAHV